MHPLGYEMKLQEPLDFYSVTDHGVRVNDILLLAHASGTARVIVGDVTNDQIDVFPCL